MPLAKLMEPAEVKEKGAGGEEGEAGDVPSQYYDPVGLRKPKDAHDWGWCCPRMPDWMRKALLSEVTAEVGERQASSKRRDIDIHAMRDGGGGGGGGGRWTVVTKRLE